MGGTWARVVIGPMISYRHKCIFIAVPKCASTSINEWFLLNGDYHSFNPFWYGGGLRAWRATRTANLVNLYPGYFTFSFVRNPFSRFLSLYHHASKNHEWRRTSSVYTIDPGSVWEFAEMCAELLREKVGWGKEAEEFYEANKAREFGPRKIPLRFLRFELGHTQQQKNFLLDYNPQTLFGVPRVNDAPCSFIGRVEHFERDFNRVLEALSVPSSSLPGRAGYIRPLGDGQYGSSYDKALRRMVEDMYSRDLDLLGYEFENENSVSVPVSVVRNSRENRSSFSWHQWIQVACLRAWYLVSGLALKLLEKQSFVVHTIKTYYDLRQQKKGYR